MLICEANDLFKGRKKDNDDNANESIYRNIVEQHQGFVCRFTPDQTS